MSKVFKLWINTDNEAFGTGEDNVSGSVPRCDETARILRVVADWLDRSPTDTFDFYQTLRDVNGNDVGRAKFVDEEIK